MAANSRLADQLRIATPCTASWEAMEGNDRVRFCHQCQLQVYNLAAMTDDEAEQLIQNRGSKRLCARMVRRADGTILTQDCPVGVKALRRQAARAVAAAMALGAFFAANIAGAVGAHWLLRQLPSNANLRFRGTTAASRVGKTLLNVEPQRQTIALGAICLPQITIPPSEWSELDIEFELPPGP